jgi:hypothetical protein
MYNISSENPQNKTYGKGNEMEFTCNSNKIKEDGDEQLLVLDKCEGMEKGISEVKLFTFNGDITR